MTVLRDDAPLALGRLVEEGRGSQPFALIHGEALVVAAAWALGEAGVQSIDHGTPWDDVVAEAGPLVLHDSLCPMTPPDFLARCVRVCRDDDTVVVGVRPVTDTVKVTVDGVIGRTVDRSELVVVCSPVVLPASVVAALAGPPDLAGTDFADLVSDLRSRFDVRLLEAPPSARRVGSLEDVDVLSALTMPS